MSRTPWIVTHDGSTPGRRTLELECLRCGTRYAPAVPVPVSLYVAAARAFIRDHRGCPPRLSP